MCYSSKWKNWDQLRYPQQGHRHARGPRAKVDGDWAPLCPEGTGLECGVGAPWVGGEANPTGKTQMADMCPQVPRNTGKGPPGMGRGQQPVPLYFTHTEHGPGPGQQRAGHTHTSFDTHALQHRTHTQKHPGHTHAHTHTPPSLVRPPPSGGQWRDMKAPQRTGAGWGGGHRPEGGQIETERDREAQIRKLSPRPWVTLPRSSRSSLAQGPQQVKVPKLIAVRPGCPPSPGTQGRVTLGWHLSGHQPTHECRDGGRPCWLGPSSAPDPDSSSKPGSHPSGPSASAAALEAWVLPRTAPTQALS